MADIQRQLSGLLGRDVQHIRKTSENPARISVIDVVAAITGHRSNGSSNAAVIFMRLNNDHPEVTTNCSDLKFPGRGSEKRRLQASVALSRSSCSYLDSMRLEFAVKLQSCLCGI